MYRFVYQTGLFHPCGHLNFGDLQSVWSFVNYLDVSKRLVDLACINDKGEVLKPPFNDSLFPAIIEEMIEKHLPPRRWILINTHPTSAELALNIVNGLDNLFGDRGLYGSDEIASVIAGHKFQGNVRELAAEIGKLLGHDDDHFVRFISRTVKEYSSVG